jgi:heat shock protein HslJ
MDAGTISLGDTTWTVVELEGRPIDGDGAPNLVLDLEESRVTGFAGLNRLMGTFSLAQDELEFGLLATTLMAGTDTAMELERRFLDTLARITSYRLDGRSLDLLADDEIAVRLAC